MPRFVNSVARNSILFAMAPILIGAVGPRTNFNERLLAAHNRERTELGLPVLEWDDQLAQDAGEWARHLSLSGKFEHSPNPPDAELQGENIWGGTPNSFLPETMVGLWIAEKENFQHGIFPRTSKTGRVEDVSHYTQVIWQKTDRVGCGVSSLGSEEVLVCRYRTAGNVIGQRV